jgi:hypothetical protein
LTCGDGTISNDALPPMILLHNKELLSTTYSDKFNTSQWSKDMSRDTYIEIPMCYNILFPPLGHNDDEYSGEGDDKKNPKDVFSGIDPTIYGTYQCRIFPISPYNDRIEQFVFVYSCASSNSIDGNNEVVLAADSMTEVPRVTSTHLQHLATNCFSADQDATLYQSPP